MFRLDSKPWVAGISPHFLVFGRQLRGFAHDPPCPRLVQAPDLERFVFRIDNQRVKMAEKVEAQHQLRAERFNKKHEKEGFADGDKVWARATKGDSTKDSPQGSLTLTGPDHMTYSNVPSPGIGIAGGWGGRSMHMGTYTLFLHHSVLRIMGWH